MKQPHLAAATFVCLLMLGTVAAFLVISPPAPQIRSSLQSAAKAANSKTGLRTMLLSVDQAAMQGTRLDARHDTFSHACSAALSASKTLLVTKAWTSLPTQSCTADLRFEGSGSLQPDNAATLTLSGSVTGPTSKIFDQSLGGVVILSKPQITLGDWWGTTPGAVNVSGSLTAPNLPTPVKCADPSNATTCTATVLAAIAATPEGGTVAFATTNYTLTSLGAINTPISIDLGGSNVALATNGVWITISTTDPIVKRKIRLMNGRITAAVGYTPTDVIKVQHEATNTELFRIKFDGVIASHSLLWNYQAYGTVCRQCEFTANTAPTMVYLSHGAPGKYTNAFTLDKSEFTADTGVCIVSEGGTAHITDTIIQGCTEGGISKTTSATQDILGITDSYLEAINGHTISTAGVTNLNIVGTTFLSMPTTELMYLTGKNTVTLNGITADATCITGKTGVVASIAIQGVNIPAGAVGCNDQLHISTALIGEAGLKVSSQNKDGSTYQYDGSSLSAVSTSACTSVPGDLVCAVGADSTINPLPIAASVSSIPAKLTVSTNPLTQGYYVGLPITVSGVTGGSYNGVSYHVTALDSTHVTLDNAVSLGTYASGGTVSMTCRNSTDAIYSTIQTFQGKRTLPANSFRAGTRIGVEGQYSLYSGPVVPAGTIFQLFFGTADVWDNGDAGVSLAPNSSGRGGALEWAMIGLTRTIISTEMLSVTVPSVSSPQSWSNNSANQYKTLDMDNPHSLAVRMAYNPTGVASGTYTSGITATGSVGQTCVLAGFNHSSTATATVALTDTNIIAPGTPLVITSRGTGAKAAPTSATAFSGTARCSGTATMSTVLGGSPGNAIMQRSICLRRN